MNDNRNRLPSDALEMAKAINGWANIDIGTDPAQVWKSGLASLPATAADIAAALDRMHATLIGECDTGDELVRHQSVENFDPTRYCHYAAHGPDAPETHAVREAVRKYFAGRAVEVVIGRGHCPTEYPFQFDWVVALDSGGGLLYSFLFNLQD